MRRFAHLFMALSIVVGGLAWTAGAVEIARYHARSEHPKQILAKLGPGKDAREMLVILDESKGTGKGYDLAIADTNLNGKLSDEKIVKGKEYRGSYYEHEFKVVAPFGNVDRKAEYSLTVLAWVAKVNGVQGAVSVHGYLTLHGGETWSYMFINGPEKKDPKNPDTVLYSLGTPVSLDVKATAKGKDLAVSAAIKDEAGQTLRFARNSARSGDVAPHLTVKGPSGETVFDKDMEYG